MTGGFSSITRVTRGAIPRVRADWHVAPALPLFVAILLWAVSLRGVDVSRMNDLGLVSVLPPLFYLSCAILIGNFILLVHNNASRTGLIVLHLVAFIVMVYGVTALVEELPRYAVNWRNIGYSEYIMRTGTVAAGLDPYFNWPGFFILAALITQVAGYHSAVVLIAWAPTVFNLLYLGPLVIIFRSLIADQRAIWLATWFFFVLNWIGQDYLAPQAINYFFFLVIVAILLRWFKAVTPDEPAPAPWPFRPLISRFPRLGPIIAPEDTPNAASTARQRGGLMLVLVIVYAVVAASHQLSPFFILAAAAVLVVGNRVTPRWLPILMLVIATTWVCYMAVPFLDSQHSVITGDAGKVSNIVGANVTSRLAGSPGHLLVTYLRTGLTLIAWGLAALGGLRRLRSGRWDLTCVLLAIAPFPFLVSQSYGGEMLQRVYLFGLPAMMLFAAALFYPTVARGRSWQTGVLVGLLCVALLAGFLTTRYGNERMDNVTSGEIAALRYLYTVAPPGSMLLSGNANAAWRFQDHERYRYLTLKAPPAPGAPVIIDPNAESIPATADAILTVFRDPRYPTGYLVITRPQLIHIEMFGDFPPGLLARLWPFLPHQAA